MLIHISRSLSTSRLSIYINSSLITAQKHPWKAYALGRHSYNEHSA
jgi:hypothetical protein